MVLDAAPFIEVGEGQCPRERRRAFKAGICCSCQASLVIVKGSGSQEDSLYVVREPNSPREKDENRLGQIRVALAHKHSRYKDSAFLKLCDTINSVDINDDLRVSRKLMALILGHEEPNSETDAHLKYHIEANEMDLLEDGRKANGRPPNEAFAEYWEELTSLIQKEAIVAEQRRSGAADQQYLPAFEGVEQLRQAAKQALQDRLGEDFKEDMIPSAYWTSLMFMPSMNAKLTRHKHKAILPVELKVQSRTLSIDHEDKHYGNAQLKYAREWALQHREHVQFLSVDDKSKVELGPPGRFPQAVIRQQPVLTLANQPLTAEDHDFSTTQLIPSVLLDMDIPESMNENYTGGQAWVILKCAVFMPSDPWRHMDETLRIMKRSQPDGIPKPLAVIYSDGGPDRSMCRASVQLAMMKLFIDADLDHLVVGRTVPYLSIYNPVERVMSVINRALQGCALQMTLPEGLSEPLFKHCPGVDKIRQICEDYPDGKEEFLRLYAEGLQQPIDIIEERVGSKTFSQKKLRVEPASTRDDVVEQALGFLSIIKNLNPPPDRNVVERIEKALCELKPVSSADVDGLGKAMKDFFNEHVIKTDYTLQFRKVKDGKCVFCSSGLIQKPRTPDFFQSVHPLPAPTPLVVKDGEVVHYKSFKDMYGKRVDGSHVPSLKKRGARSLQGNKARFYMTCATCRKPRVLYGDEALGKDRKNKNLLNTILEFEWYHCGTSFKDLVNLDSKQSRKLFTRLDDIKFGFTDRQVRALLESLANKLAFSEDPRGWTCEDPLEAAYFSSQNLEAAPRDVCLVCGTNDHPRIRGENDHNYKWVARACVDCISSHRTTHKMIHGKRLRSGGGTTGSQVEPEGE